MAEDKLTPKQIEFLRYYTDPKSPTFSNALQSALKAGYSQEYSEVITSQDNEWLSENLGDLKRLKKAESNLDYFLNDCDDDKVKADITKFVAKGLGKNKYSERTEMTGANGEKIPILVKFINEGEDNCNTPGISETV